jgi:HK97 gp10 family phage protein
MNTTVEFTGIGDIEAALKSINDQLNSMIMEGLEESGEEMARAMQAADHRNLSHNSFTVQKRKTTVAVGPSKDGARAHIVRFWEFGTINNPAEGLMRKVADASDRIVKAKMASRLRKAIEIAGKGAKRK